MPTSAGTLAKGALKPRALESLAFYLGAHGIDPAPSEHEIDARLAQEASEEKESLLLALHDLETKRDQARRERPEAETLWARIRKESGDTAPPYFHAAVMAVFAFFALALDTLFLAPTMDILNVANPVLQYFAASGVAAVSTALFDLAGVTYMDARDSIPKRVIAVAAGVIVALCLTVWGLLRGYEFRFAAGLAGNPLGQFLGAHPLLSACFYVFITLATPLVGAAALLYGWTEFSRARIWRQTRKRFEILRADEIRLTREVETEKERLAHFDQRKDAKCREWTAIFRQFYERGQRNGARKETLWSVIRKTALGGLLATPFAFLVPFAWFPAQLAVPIIPVLACFIYFNHRRHHPSHERYLKAEATRFAVIPDAPAPPTLPALSQHLLPKED